MCEIALSIPGEHNILNAVSAFACCHILGVDVEDIVKTLNVYTGTQRRFDVLGKTYNNMKIVDDYAHHPTAIKYVIEATRVRYPGKEIVAIFQPDRFSKRRKIC